MYWNPYEESQRIKTQAIEVNDSRIVRHLALIKSLELVLDRDKGGIFEARLMVSPSYRVRESIRRWTDERIARTEFAQMEQAITSGNYKIGIYEGGCIDLEFTK